MAHGDYGERIRLRRKERHLTLKEVGRKVTCSYQQVANIETYKNTTVSRLDEVAAAVGLEVHIAAFDPAVEDVRVITPEQAQLLDALAKLPARRKMLVERLATVTTWVSDEMIGALLALVSGAEREHLSQRRSAAVSDSPD